MDGDIAKLPEIVEAAEAVGAAVMVDDAHASGVLGRNGRGTIDHFGLHGRVAIQVGTLSKAVGVLGGYVAGSQDLRDILTQRARPFLFSTSHPPAVAAACLEAIHVLEEEPELIDRLWANTRRFKAELARLGFDTGASETPITPVMMGDSATAGTVQRPALRGGRLRPADRLPDRRPRQGADPHDRDRGAHRRAARDRARRVRPDRPGDGPDRGVTSPDPALDPQARDLPLDAHLHTDRSADSDVPIDAYAAAAVARRIGELAITDHIDFDPRAAELPARHGRPRADRPRGRRALGAARDRDPVRARGDVRVRARGRDPRPSRRPPVRLRDRLRARRGRQPVPRLAGRPVGGGEDDRRDRRSLLRRGRGGGPERAVRRARPSRLREALRGRPPEPRRRSPNGSTCTSRSSVRSSTRGPRSRSTPAGCARHRARRTPVRPSSPASGSSGASG